MSCVTCKRCLLSTDVPGVKVQPGQICSVCAEHDQVWGDWDQKRIHRETELAKVLDRVRGKKKSYDVLVPLSGGKDSTYVLYLCRKRFNLKCLAVTIDNGFLTEHARQNVKKACNTLGVDHCFYGLDRGLLIRLYRHFFLKTGFFCPVCSAAIGIGIFRVQIGFRIPLMIRGSTGRTEEYVSDAFFLAGTPSFMENVLDDVAVEDLKRQAAPLFHFPGLFRSPPALKLPDYVEWVYDEIYKTITSELGWKASRYEEEHTDCGVHDVVDYIRFRKFPALVPDMLRFSKLVTAGLMTRQEAKRRVLQNQPVKEPDSLGVFLDDLDITREKFERVIGDPMRHMPYLQERSRIWRRMRGLRSELFLEGL